MVVVTNEPFPETEPMLSPATSDHKPEGTAEDRRNSHTEEAYKNIRTSVKVDPLQITCPNLGCDLLLTAVKVQNIVLARQCIEDLDSKLDEHTALSILSNLTKIKTALLTGNNFEPSAPPLDSGSDNGHQQLREDDWVEELISDLRHNCLLEIDKHADFVLTQKTVLDLAYSDILEIVVRDTLQVTNEQLVYAAVMKWGAAECRRRKLKPGYVKAVLRDLRYAPRYGLLTKKQFQSRVVDGIKGPTRSGILDEKEWRKILFFIKETSKNRSVEDLPHKESVPRILINEKPKILSARSTIRSMELPLAKSAQFGGGGTTYCEKFLLNVLTCWSAIFD